MGLPVHLSHLQHELAVVPPHEDHLTRQAMAGAAAAHQEPGSETHLRSLAAPGLGHPGGGGVRQ